MAVREVLGPNRVRPAGSYHLLPNYVVEAFSGSDISKGELTISCRNSEQAKRLHLQYPFRTDKRGYSEKRSLWGMTNIKLTSRLLRCYLCFSILLR